MGYQDPVYRGYSGSRLNVSETEFGSRQTYLVLVERLRSPNSPSELAMATVES